jgi:hypothetical protein
MTNHLAGPYQMQLHLGRRTTPTLAKKLLATSEFILLKQALPSPKQIPGWFMNFHTYTCAGFLQDRRIRAANAPSIPCLCGKETKKPSTDTIEGGTKV